MTRRLTGIILIRLVSVAGAPAQEQTASIEGVVRDASGAVIPGVSVIADNRDGLAVPW